jgi:hypothetical protein
MRSARCSDAASHGVTGQTAIMNEAPTTDHFHSDLAALQRHEDDLAGVVERPIGLP